MTKDPGGIDKKARGQHESIEVVAEERNDEPIGSAIFARYLLVRSSAEKQTWPMSVRFCVIRVAGHQSPRIDFPSW